MPWATSLLVDSVSHNSSIRFASTIARSVVGAFFFFFLPSLQECIFALSVCVLCKLCMCVCRCRCIVCM